MKRLNKINLLLPGNTENENKFYNDFILFLSNIPNSHKNKNTISFIPKFPNRSWPVSYISQSRKNHLQINFLDKNNKAFEFKNNLIDNILTKINDKNDIDINTIDVLELLKLFKNKLLRLDHLGINIPSSLVKKSEYYDFITSLGNTCNFHHYPSGKDWDFILPSSRPEWKNGISEFKLEREPKWEFVYDDYTDIPVIQLCIETKLTKKQMCELLPDPLGISYKGLPFRIVFLRMPWSGISIRCDMKTYSTKRENSWNTAEYLAKRGKRIGNFI